MITRLAGTVAGSTASAAFTVLDSLLSGTRPPLQLHSLLHTVISPFTNNLLLAAEQLVQPGSSDTTLSSCTPAPSFSTSASSHCTAANISTKSSSSSSSSQGYELKSENAIKNSIFVAVPVCGSIPTKNDSKVQSIVEFDDEIIVCESDCPTGTSEERPKRKNSFVEIVGEDSHVLKLNKPSKKKKFNTGSAEAEEVVTVADRTFTNVVELSDEDEISCLDPPRPPRYPETRKLVQFRSSGFAFADPHQIRKKIRKYEERKKNLKKAEKDEGRKKISNEICKKLGITTSKTTKESVHVLDIRSEHAETTKTSEEQLVIDITSGPAEFALEKNYGHEKEDHILTENVQKFKQFLDNELETKIEITETKIEINSAAYDQTDSVNCILPDSAGEKVTPTDGKEETEEDDEAGGDVSRLKAARRFTASRTSRHSPALPTALKCELIMQENTETGDDEDCSTDTAGQDWNDDEKTDNNIENDGDTKDKETKPVCQECWKTFKTKQGLSSHKRSKHKNSEPEPGFGESNTTPGQAKSKGKTKCSPPKNQISNQQELEPSIRPSSLFGLVLSPALPLVDQLQALIDQEDQEKDQEEDQDLSTEFCSLLTAPQFQPVISSLLKYYQVGEDLNLR